MRESDGELMARCKNGDMSAFDLIVRRYKTPLVNFAYRFTGDREAAEDLAQETFIRIYKNVNRYKENTAGFRTWMYRIAANLCKNEIRNRRRHGLSSLEELLTDEEGKRNYALMTDYSQIPELLYEKKEQQMLIKQAIDRLPQNQRLAIIMVTYQNLRYDEIANALGCSVSAVKSLIHRARQNLKKYLIESDIGGGYNAKV